MKQSRNVLLLGAVMAAVPVLGFTLTAHAQYRVDTGRVNDANNRMGSGGYNTGHDLNQPSLGINNSLGLTNNLTGLSNFQGNSQVFNPNVVQTNTQSAPSDILNQIAGPVDYKARSTGQSTAQPFYSTASVNQTPPPGLFRTTSNNVGYLPAQQLVQQPNDTRLGVINNVPSQAFAAPEGELDLPGPVDTSGNPTMTTFSPLYGVRDRRTGDAGDEYFLSRYSNAAPDSFNPLDSITIQRMRNQVNNTMTQGPNMPGAQPAAPGGNGLVDTGAQNGGNVAGSPAGPGGVAGASQNLANGQRVNGGAQAPGTATVGSLALNAPLNSQPINSNLATDQGVQQRVVDLPAPGQQSSQIAALEQRLQQQANGPLSQSQSAQLYNSQLRLKQKIQAQKQANAAALNPPNNTAPGGDNANTGAQLPNGFTPNGNANAPAKPPLKPIVTQAPSSPSEQPLVITSLASGIHASGLAELMRSAEDQMRQGKFNAALDTYDAAEQVAPNNPFIRLGRGFAELGASYYGRAEADLRRSIVAEPALLQGSYDLKGFLGEDRLQFVTKDLQDILHSEKNNEQAAFLLAYISHNTGNQKQAAAYLNTAQQREGGQADGVLNLMRKAWDLPRQ